MRLSRFPSRRSVRVASAGYFSVLKTDMRTVDPRPAGGYQPASQTQRVLDSPERIVLRLQTVKIPLIGDSGMLERGQIRMALITAAAASFTYFLLWWIMRGHF